MMIYIYEDINILIPLEEINILIPVKRKNTHNFLLSAAFVDGK